MYYHIQAIASVAVLPDGRLVSGSEDRTIRVWDIDLGQCVKVLDLHTYVCIP